MFQIEQHEGCLSILLEVRIRGRYEYGIQVHADIYYRAHQTSVGKEQSQLKASVLSNQVRKLVESKRLLSAAISFLLFEKNCESGS
jgi:hypothetical protein